VTRAPRPLRAAVVTTYVATAAAAALAAYLVWALRTLIVPVVAGGLLAYICRPFIGRLERTRIPRGLAIALLLLVFVVGALVGLNSVRAAIPSEEALLELRVRVLYALHQRYQALMGLDASWTRGNRLYALAHRDLDPLVDRVGDALALTADERAQLVASLEHGTGPAAARSRRLVEQERANAHTLHLRGSRPGGATAAATRPGGSTASPVPAAGAESAPVPLGEILASWAIAPLIFLFLLSDTGRIKRSLLAAVPNRLFEPALAVIDDVDRALGNYVRGIFLECCALGASVIVLTTLVGVPPRWAIAIGIFTGASNVIPYMGFAAALLGGLTYALLAEDVRPLIPLVTTETFVLWVVGAVVLAELLKNVVYEPIVLGGAVHLHPLAVVLGVVGGAMLFGPAGMFLAIPTMTIAKVLVASSARHLKAYGLV
jgi:predicted PurR-regulated permease PerM